MDMNIAHNGSCLLFLRNARYICAPDVTSRLTYCDAHCLDYLGAVRCSDTFNVSTSFRLLFIQIPIPQVLLSERILITLFIWIEIPHGRMPGKIKQAKTSLLSFEIRVIMHFSASILCFQLAFHNDKRESCD